MTNQELNKYYEELLATIGTKGFELIIEDAYEQIEKLREELERSFNETKANYNRGYISALRNLISMKDRIEISMQLAEEESEQ